MKLATPQQINSIPSLATGQVGIRKTTRKDKALVVDILSQAFRKDPQIHWLSGGGRNKAKKVKALMSFAFEQRHLHGDVYITTDQQAVAIWRNEKRSRFSLLLFKEYLRFLLLYGLKQVRKINRMDQEIHQHYPKNKPFYYLWILGTSEAGRGKGLSSKLMNALLAKADLNQIDVFLETANPKNLPIYRKKGFEVYNQIAMPGEKDMYIYLLKRSKQNLSLN